MLLESMKVISFCHVLQGPAATQYLGDMGADVIKVEPLGGERARKWAGRNIYPGGVSGFYLAAARNKRALAVDLKSKEGLEIIFKLIESADVVLENFRSGVMDRLGLSYEEVRKRKPDIIYASGTGWGRTGPMVGKTSQDLIIQARTGLMRATGVGRATPAGAAVVDQHGGALLAMAVSGAYAKKLATGQGTHIESSLFGAGLDLQTEPLTVYMSGRPGDGVHTRDPHLATWYHETPYGVYQLADAEVAISSNDMDDLAEALDSDALRKLTKIDRFIERDVYADAIGEVLKTRRYDDVAAAFEAKNIWFGKVYNYEDVANDPQAAAANVFAEVDINGEKAILVNHPVRYDGETPPIRRLPLEVGEDTKQILEELGYRQAAINTLLKRGVVGAPGSEADVSADAAAE
jgi:crotonobetainyl-CoA:carnitine CoA-transferase CaiB-like acyl-CoA transferase